MAKFYLYRESYEGGDSDRRYKSLCCLIGGNGGRALAWNSVLCVQGRGSGLGHILLPKSLGGLDLFLRTLE